MDVLDAVRGRRSIRRYTGADLPAEMLDKLLEALIWAPSAGNLQSRKFYFVRDKALKLRLAAAALDQAFIADAPLVVVGCTDSLIHSRYGERGVGLYSVQDVSASIMCMMLVAHSIGLGTCWVGAFSEDAVIKALDLPAGLRPVALVPVGSAERVPHAPDRVSRAEAVTFL